MMDEVSESILLANETRSLQGCHECEVNFGSEADLQKHKLLCRKNPGHADFIQIKDFSIKNLPSIYQDEEVVELIKVMAIVTVKLTVSYTSENRPPVFPDTNAPYPFYRCRGSDKFTRSGSGKCVDFYKRSEVNNEPCPCTACQESGKPVKTWAAIILHTATHVVFDNSEARQTKCVLGYDEEGKKGVTLEAIDVVGGRADVSGDRCLLRCVTHDFVLVDTLWSYSRIYRDKFRRVNDKYKIAAAHGSAEQNKMVVISSHPHGCAKHITVGYWNEMTRGQPDFGAVRYTYTAATCPGSSGAPVYIIGKGNEWWNHTHSGAAATGNLSSTIYIQE